MIDKIIGFIGAGNMGSAMIGGIVHSELVTTSQIIASAHSAWDFRYCHHERTPKRNQAG